MTMLHTEAQRRKRSEGGFTLVELLVVIVIIGILAAVAVFAVAGITDKGQDSACEADERAVLTAIEAARAQSDDPSTENPTMTELVPDFLSEESDLHTITYGSNGAVTLTGVDDCAPPAAN